MRRSLIHFWPINLAVLAAAGVATAVLAGSLVVGDSIEASLRDLTLERLGLIDHAVLAERPFAAELADRLAAELEPGASVVPVVALRGSAVHAEGGARAARVAVWGVDAGFRTLFPGDPAAQALELTRRPGQVFPSLVLNSALARELGAQVGDQVVVAFEHRSEVPRSTLLGGDDPEAALRSLRLVVSAVVPDRGAGRFSLAAGQVAPLNAFVELPVLARRLERPGVANALLVAGPQAVDRTAAALGRALELADVGLRLTPAERWLTLDSRELVLRPQVVAAATAAGEAGGRAVLPLLTYLANRMETGGRAVPYSTVTALPLPPPSGFGDWSVGAGTARPASGDTPPIVLNRWAADDLGVTPGAELEMTYFTVGSRDRLETARARFRVAGVVEMSGLAADPSLTPELPGIADADRMADWEPPFPVDLSLVRPEDERYWDAWRGTPKAFVPLAEGQRLWRSRFGALTALRFALERGETPERAATALAEAVLDRLSPAELGLTVLPVRRQGLEASSGTTSFAGLFVGFSLFLIVAAALLVALLFRLGVERRARELGLRLAAGYPLRSVRRLLLAEGTVLAAAGGALGLGLAALYGRAVLAGIGGWWAPLLGSPFLRLELRPASLAAGLALSLAVVIGSILLTLRRLGRVPVRALLAGAVESPNVDSRPPRAARRLAVAALLAAGALVAWAAGGPGEASPGLFFGAGAAVLTGGFALFAAWCRGSRGAGGGLTLAASAARNTAHSPGRSLLAVVLVGSACFVLVAVAANRRQVEDATARDSGTGGFALVAESAVPLTADLDSAEGRAELGLGTDDRAALAGSRIYPLRLRPGEDASCLNLYQPQRPRLLGVTDELVARGGFRFRTTVEPTAEPWRLLERQLEPGVVPAIGDANSVQWILHLGLGDELALHDDRGRPVRLRIVATLDTSIFQSELLIPERAFLEHFPDSEGFAYFLAEAPPGRAGELARRLEESLARYGLDATPAADKLEAYMAVEHMYLDTFQALGGLGLLLGTLGLAVVLARSVIERRGELATLRAFGYRRRTLAWLVVGENGFLLAVGIGIGAAAGLLAVAPHLAASAGEVPWGALAGTLALVLAVGLAAGAVAVSAALRTPLLPALKSER